MGGKSSKSKGDKKDKSKKKGKGKGKAQVDEQEVEKEIEEVSSGKSVRIHREDPLTQEFSEIVMETLRINMDLLTLREIEFYISSRYKTSDINLDSRAQKRIIQKVVADAFLKGCLAIRPTGRGSVKSFKSV